MAGAGKKTFTAGETLTASDVNNYLMEQSVMVFGGTAARSSAIPTPSEGMFAVTTDNDELDYYNGSAWVPALPVGAWNYDTTTVTGTTNPTFSTNTRKWYQIGKQVTVQFSLTFTATVGTGTYTFDLPVTADTTFVGIPAGIVIIRDASAGANTVTYFRVTSATAGRVFSMSGSSDMTQTSPFTVASGDIIWGTFTYEAA